MAAMKKGERTDLPSIDGKSVSQSIAAKSLNVSVPSVQRTKAVLRDGAAEVVRAVDRGKLLER